MACLAAVPKSHGSAIDGLVKNIDSLVFVGAFSTPLLETRNLRGFIFSGSLRHEMQSNGRGSGFEFRRSTAQISVQWLYVLPDLFLDFT